MHCQHRVVSGRRAFRPRERMTCHRLGRQLSARAEVTIPHMRGSDPRDEFDEVRFAELGMSGSELPGIAARVRARSNRRTPACRVGHERFRLGTGDSVASGRDQRDHLSISPNEFLSTCRRYFVACGSIHSSAATESRTRRGCQSAGAAL